MPETPLFALRESKAWVEGWGEKADNCNRITIKIKKKKLQLILT